MTLGRVDVAVMSEMERQRVNTKTGRKKSRFANFISSLFPNKSYMANKISVCGENAEFYCRIHGHV